MGFATLSSFRSNEIASERRALGLGCDIPVGWMILGLVAAINTASTVFMLAGL